MYVPPAFAESDLQTLHDFMEQHSFATVVSQGDIEPVASHLPLLIEREKGTMGRLVGHMAKANSHWTIADGEQVLVIFHGPHAYISPAWYEAKNTVPTWNYAAVHVYGSFRLDNSPEQRMEIVRKYVDAYEQPREQPWLLPNAEDDFIDRLLDMIVGFYIEIERIEGKWKLSQNHDPVRRRRVIEALKCGGSDNAREIAELMAKTDCGSR